MESQLIYIANQKMKTKVTWSNSGDTEWIYFGAAEEVNTNMVLQTINFLFSETQLYISHTRKGSFKIEKNLIIDSIKNILGFEDFVIWDTMFTKAIEFNKIGVFRYGEISS